MNRKFRRGILFSVFVSLVLGSWLGVPPTFAGMFEGIRHISGGVGIEEREAMKLLAADYNLQLVFSKTSGSYVAGVRVTIENSEGKEILDALSDGPWFFADLPAGKYRVTAVYRDVARQKEAMIQSKPVKVHFFWGL